MHDPNAALVRYHLREAARQRQRETQRRALLSAARPLIRDHGLSATLAQIAVLAGLSPSVGRAIFPSTTELAIDLVVDAWAALIEQLARRPAEPPAAVIAWLIEAIRADATAHRIRRVVGCGTTDRQGRIITEADGRLAQAITDRLRQTWPGLPPDDPAGLGRRAFALASSAALAPAAPDAGAEAALIADMLAAAVPSAPARPQPNPLPWADDRPGIIRFTRLPRPRGDGPCGNA
jgi:AcrR family transcriptional regulator